ncbi:UNVERIFIED_CONTAM: hypothetical protein K2H54_006281 [Gekko kuhli]
MPAPADVMPALADTPEEAPASQEPVDLQAPEDSTAAERQRLDPVVESDLSDFQAFKAYFATAYANPVKAETANQKIRALTQQKTSVAQYTTEFQLLAQDLAWNEAAFIDQYTEGLSDEILDELARSERPHPSLSTH